MSSKTVWVVGGLALAIGAVAYLSYHETPAGKDAAGTIVAAKRALFDSSGGSGTSTTSTTPSSDGSSTDRNASDQGRNGDNASNDSGPRNASNDSGPRNQSNDVAHE